MALATVTVWHALRNGMVQAGEFASLDVAFSTMHSQFPEETYGKQYFSFVEVTLVTGEVAAPATPETATGSTESDA